MARRARAGHRELRLRKAKHQQYLTPTSATEVSSCWRDGGRALGCDLLNARRA